MSVLLGALNVGRSRAESRMTETVTFYRVTGTHRDPDTLLDVEDRLDLHVGIPARMKLSTLTVSERNIPGQQIAVQSPEVHVPVGATPNVKVDDYCIVTASTADASLVNRKMRVAGKPQAGQVTAHRYPVSEVSPDA